VYRERCVSIKAVGRVDGGIKRAGPFVLNRDGGRFCGVDSARNGKFFCLLGKRMRDSLLIKHIARLIKNYFIRFFAFYGKFMNYYNLYWHINTIGDKAITYAYIVIFSMDMAI